MAVRVQDRGANDLLKRMRAAQRGMKVKVGVIGSEAAAPKTGASLTVADVASFHEFGLGVPPRSWLREYVDENDAEIRRRLRKIAESVLRRKQDVRVGLNQLGGLLVGEIQARMASGPGWKELSEAYVKRRGLSDRTARLIGASEQLRSSITYVVEPGGAEGTT